MNVQNYNVVIHLDRSIDSIVVNVNLNHLLVMLNLVVNPSKIVPCIMLETHIVDVPI